MPHGKPWQRQPCGGVNPCFRGRIFHASAGGTACGADDPVTTTGLPQDIRARLEAVTGSEVIASAPMAVGFGLVGARVKMADGRDLAVKAARNGDTGLPLQAFMLGELGRLGALPVPRVVHVEPGLLVMDWIDHEGGPIAPQAQRHAGELLAALHARPFADFGYDRDTPIGPLSQPNKACETWLAFFRDRRLLHMAEVARDHGALPAPLFTRLQRLAGRLDRYLAEPAHPALIHGDLWTGNVLARGDRIAGFVDPAIYCAHPEIELAFTTMFGTFGRAFFEAYGAVTPIEPGFHELRRDLYNLYPTLVHVRLFGAGYLLAIERVLARLGL